MSERSLRRAHERAVEKERRREALRRRRMGLATGVAVGAAALFAGPAQAATFTVNSLADHEPDACDSEECTLRDAIAEANSTANVDGVPDEVTFASELTGEIALTVRDIRITDAVTINGPGADVLSVSGDNDGNGLDEGDFRIFSVYSSGVTIEGLTLTEGGGVYDNGYESAASSGGAVRAGSDVSFVDTVVTGNSSVGNGGGIWVTGGAELSLLRTDVTNNTAAGGGGGIAVQSQGVETTITDSTISGNTVSGGDGAGILAERGLVIRNSVISGNTGANEGGGINQEGKYAPLELTGSTVSGNGAVSGAGISISPSFGKYTPTTQRSIEQTTIAGNTATEDGGGIYVRSLGDGDTFRISRSTLSGNNGGERGGAIQLGGNQYGGIGGDFVVSNSTVSGNTAGVGGGIGVGEPGVPTFYNGGAEFANSTVAANTGGGIYLASYSTGDETRSTSTVALTSTIAANNTGSDLDQADDADGGGFDLAFSLVEAPGDASLFQSDGDYNIVGTDPQLGGLANNGGPTQTHAPATTSPAVDKGDAPPRLDTDQRGGPRTLDGAPANPEGGDGTDIGSVEIDRVPGSTTTPPPATNDVVFQRVRPRGISIRITPTRDRSAPFTFRTTGRILPPTGMSNAQACGSLGVVSVQVQRRKTTISNRRTTIRPNCTFSSRVTFKNRKRFAGARRLKFTVRFTGNDVLEAFVANARFRRVR